MKNAALYLLFVLLLGGCAAPGAVEPSTSPADPMTASASATAAPSATPRPTDTATATATPLPTATPTPAPAVLIGAGDIAFCGEPYLGDEATADLIGQFPDAVVFTAGDNVYGDARLVEYTNCFGPSWGRFLDQLHPVPGNHDYSTDQGAPYFAYFGAAAGEAGKGWYSYDVGEWHVVALNSNCDFVACGPNSAQVEWLRQDLAASKARCTLAHWHSPRWSSGLAGNYGSINPFWRTVFAYGVEIVVSGNDHDYERFAPMDDEGNPTANGVRQFVVGTGGGELRVFGETKPNSEVRYNEGHGVIKFLLYPDHYTWEFLSVDGSFTDSGTGTCH